MFWKLYFILRTAVFVTNMRNSSTNIKVNNLSFDIRYSNVCINIWNPLTTIKRKLDCFFHEACLILGDL